MVYVDSVPIVFGDPRFGFVLQLSVETVAKTGINKALVDGDEGFIGHGSPSGHHMVMSAITAQYVVVVLSSEPGSIEGMLLDNVTPESPHWRNVVTVVNRAANSMVVGIPGLVRRVDDGTFEIYVVTAELAG